MVVDDLAAARTWYEQVLGSPPDAAPMEGLLEWHLAGSGWLQVVDVDIVRTIQQRANWGAAGSSSAAFVVDSLDDQLGIFTSNGIPVGPVYTTGPSFKTATVADPSGNLLTFVEELDRPQK